MDKQELKKQFYKAILSLKNPEECEAFFSDICTIKELDDLSSRLEVAKMLKDGWITKKLQREQAFRLQL